MIIYIDKDKVVGCVLKLFSGSADMRCDSCTNDDCGHRFALVVHAVPERRTGN